MTEKTQQTRPADIAFFFGEGEQSDTYIVRVRGSLTVNQIQAAAFDLMGKALRADEAAIIANWTEDREQPEEEDVCEQKDVAISLDEEYDEEPAEESPEG